MFEATFSVNSLNIHTG